MESKVYLEKIKKLVKIKLIKERMKLVRLYDKGVDRSSVSRRYKFYLDELDLINNIYTLFDFMFIQNFTIDECFEIVLNAAAPGIIDGRRTLQF